MSGAGNHPGEPGISCFITKQENYQRYRHYVKKETGVNLKRLSWPKMGQFEHNDCNRLKQIKYVKLHVFIKTPDNKDLQVNFAGC